MYSSTRRSLVMITVVAATVAGGCGDDGADDPADGATTDGAAGSDPMAAVRSIELPGDRVFPEGVAIDSDGDQIYVGSTEDGTVYRATLDDDRAEVFLPPGADGRTAVTGLAVADGQLVVAGRDTGRIFAYDTESGQLIGAFYTSGEGERALINDITVAGDAAYVTDSFRPVLWRLDLGGDDVGAPEPWLQLDGSPITYGDGFNLNGITTNDDGSTLLTVHATTGELFRIDTASGDITTVDLGGELLIGGDGLELDGTTLVAIADGDLVTIELDEELRNGAVTQRTALDAQRYPTTLALTDDDYIIVNSQLDMTGNDAEPTLPFTLSVIPRA